MLPEGCSPAEPWRPRTRPAWRLENAEGGAVGDLEVCPTVIQGDGGKHEMEPYAQRNDTEQLHRLMPTTQSLQHHLLAGAAL